MYELPSSHDERSRVQNDFVKKAWENFENCKIIALEAPAGFGKTFMALQLAKNFSLEKKQTVLIATAATNHTINFWKDHLKQEGILPSGVNLSFLIGKANQTYKPCYYLEENPIETKPTAQQFTLENFGKKVKKEKFSKKESKLEENIYTLCEILTGHKECKHFQKVYGDKKDSAKTLTPEAEIAANRLQSILSGPKLDCHEKELLKLIQKIKEKTLCPYYLFKHNFSQAQVKICDYQYLINPKYLEEKTEEYVLVIDEFDKFEERLTEQFKISLSMNQLNNIQNDLMPQYRNLFRYTFQNSDSEKNRTLASELEQYAFTLKDFLAKVSKNLHLEEPIGINFEKEFFENKEYSDSHYQFNKFFEENEESFIKIITNTNMKNNPYRHLLAFHYRLALSLEQKDAISFVESLTKKRKNFSNDFDTIFVRRPLVFTEFYQNLAKRFDKILIMSATLPFKEMLELNFNQKISLLTIPKQLGLTGLKQGIILNHPFFDYSNKQRTQNVEIKNQMLSDLIDSLSSVKKEIVVFFNAFSSLNAGKIQLFKLLEDKKFKIFLDEELENQNRDENWEKFKKFKGKKVLFSTMYTKYARGSNILKDNGCRILVLVGIPYPHVFDFEAKKFNELALKHKWPLTAETWYYVLGTRKTFTQTIGRLTRHKKDYGYFIIASNKNIEKILDKEHRSMLDISTETPYIFDVTQAAKQFFETVEKAK